MKQETLEPPGGEGDTIVKMEPLEGSGSEGDRSPGGSMSLDMLAQVASDRLESEPRRRPKKKPVSLLQSRQRVKVSLIDLNDILKHIYLTWYLPIICEHIWVF